MTDDIHQLKTSIAYHYTSLEVLQKLIEGIVEKDGQRYFVFHASSIFSMNDPQEFYWGYQIVLNQLKSLDKKHHTKGIFKISTFAEHYSQELFYQVFIDSLYKQKLIPFIICFSTCRDSLPMWSMYSKNGKGVCLGFRHLDTFLHLENNDIKDVSFVKHLQASEVYYDNSVLSSALNTIDFGYERYLNEVHKIGVNQGKVLWNIKINYIASIMVCIAPYIKTKDYKFENELRLFQSVRDEQEVKYKVNAEGHLIPYVDTLIPVDWLSEIIVGPCLCYKPTEQALNCELMQKGLPDIKISRSSVSYRIY